MFRAKPTYGRRAFAMCSDKAKISWGFEYSRSSSSKIMKAALIDLIHGAKGKHAAIILNAGA